jgi:uncharacterized protein YuzE
MEGKKVELCLHCGGDVRIRNPMGNCDHLHYPECCPVCMRFEKAKKDAYNEGRFVMKDVSIKNIEIKISHDGKVVWVNTESGCMLRACGISHLMLLDERTENESTFLELDDDGFVYVDENGNEPEFDYERR